MTRRRLTTLASAFAALLAAVAIGRGQEPPRGFDAAEKLFEQKNYLEAAAAYAAYLADNGAREPEKAWKASTQGLLADAAGRPVFEPAPAAYAPTLSPVGKMKFLLEEAVKLDATDERRFEAEALYRRAMLARARYGPDRVAQDWRHDHDTTGKLSPLADDEALTLLGGKLAVVRLPADEDVLALLARARGLAKSGVADLALLATGMYRQSREQFLPALAAFDELVTQFPKSPWLDHARMEAGRIRKQEVILEPSAVQLAGDAAVLKITHRNVDEVAFEARRLDLPRAIDDILAEIEKDDPNANGGALQQLSYFLLEKDRWKRYAAERPLAAWKAPVERRADMHYAHADVAAPVTERGCYVVIATAGDARAVGFFLLDDLAVVEKDTAKGKLIFVCDARTGRPVAGARVDIVERWTHWEKSDTRVHQHLVRSQAKSGEDGTLETKHGCPERSCQLIAIARTGDGRLAASGVDWWGRQEPSVSWSGWRGIVITDRPVYRPKDTAHVKAFLRRVENGAYGEAARGDVHVLVTVFDPRGEEILRTPCTTDAMGGIDFDLPIGVKAPLGVYSIQLIAGGSWGATSVQAGGNTLRVEEYKKPEYEVTVEPGAAQVRLGEKITAVVRARYHFGGPVAEAHVAWKVFREPFTMTWAEPGPWDWLYGAGYGRCLYPCRWFEWWDRWGFFWGGAAPRELVKTGEGPIGADGTLAIEIETERASKDHGDTDHRYIVEAEVRDASRRTIAGEGAVLATRQSVYAFVETDRGFYRPGETVFAMARTLLADMKPAKAAGAWSLARVLYTGENGARIVEEPVAVQDATPDEEGRVAFSFVPQESGQFRLSFKTKDAWGQEVLGTTILWVHGGDLAGRAFKFNDLELVTDKRTYKPGETAHVLVRTARPGATVIFADRVDSGALLSWRVIQLATQAQVVDVPLAKGDVPNRWIEATVVDGGRVHSEAREILVPPPAAVAEIAVKPDKSVYKPGEMGTVEITAKTPDGAPLVAAIALSVFDKAVLQIQPEMTPDIRAFFWGERRWHNVRRGSSLDRQMTGSVAALNPQYPQGAWTVPGWQGSFGPRGMDWRADGAYKDFDGWGYGGGADKESHERLAAEAPAPPGQPAETSGRVTHGLKAAGDTAAYESARKSEASASGSAPLKQAEVRTKFADTALWVPSIVTGRDGKATIKVPFPENLTTWRIRAHGMTAETRVGMAAEEVKTTKNLLVRLAAPRFFVERDEVVLSAIVMNRLATEKTARVAIALPERLLGLCDGVQPTVEVKVAANGEQRVDWRVRALAEGRGRVMVEALTDEESDAMQVDLPVLVHGAERQIAKTGTVKAEETIALAIPDAIRPGESRLRVRVSPSLAAAMLEALPYLLDYPYGCTEQTLHRFTPAAVTAKTLGDAGVDLEELANAFAKLNTQSSDNPLKRRQSWDYGHLPVFDKRTLAAIVAEGLERLYLLQHGDGGWGWWSNDQSSAYMTALVLDGLVTVEQADVKVKDGVIDRGLAYLRAFVESDLEKLRKEPARLQERAFASYVLSRKKKQNDEVVSLLDKHRDLGGAYGLGLLALTYHEMGKDERGREVLRNLLQRVEKDDENETAWVRTETDGWWWWWNDAIETNATALKALVALDSGSPLAPRLVKWLLDNRRNGFYWRSTRDTAAVIDAFSDYLRASKELEPDLDVTLAWDGAAPKSFHISRENIFTFDGALDLEGAALTPGPHALKITRKGRGALYYTAYLSYFTLEEDVPPAGLEVKVERRYAKLTPIARETATTGARGEGLTEERLRYKKTALASGDAVASGDLIEVELLVTSKNDYDFLCFEDPKPAGCEPVALTSGARFGELCSNMELRDEKVAFFVTWLAQGEHRITYRLRAEAPGRFHVLPAHGFAMYAPELRGNAAEMRLGVMEAPALR